MALGKKTGGRDVQKGQVLNPKGAGAHNPLVKEIRKMTKESIAEMLQAILHSSPDDVIDYKPKTLLEDWVMKGIIVAKRKGDLTPLNALLDRVVGKVKDNVAVEGDVGIRIVLEDYLGVKEDK
jgi:hypothetical protein